MNGHGGARKGAGRPSIIDRHPEKIEQVRDEFAKHLKPAFWRLWELINPPQRFERKYIPATMVMRKGIAKDDEGNIIRDFKGKPVIIDVAAFPEAEEEHLVLVEEKRIDQPPNVVALKEFFERTLGRAGVSIEEFGLAGDGPAMDLKNLAPGDLDELERIARLVVGGGPVGGAQGGGSGADAPRPG